MSVYNNYKNSRYNSDDDIFAHSHPENFGDSYKNSKSEFGGNSNGNAPGATYYYPPHSGQYMMPYNPSMVYQQMPYQTPYTSSYSPGGSNSDFNENSAMFYMKQPYINYPPQMSHHHHNQHMSSYVPPNNMQTNNSNNMSERSYPHTTADPSVIPSALQPPLSYSGKCNCPHILLCFHDFVMYLSSLISFIFYFYFFSFPSSFLFIIIYYFFLTSLLSFLFFLSQQV